MTEKIKAMKKTKEQEDQQDIGRREPPGTPAPCYEGESSANNDNEKRQCF